MPPGRYKTFGELNKHVIKPAVAEVNALAAFTVTVLPYKQGKKVVGVKIGWWAKENRALREVWEELNRSKVGRKARIAGTVEHHVSDPLPSVQRLMRDGRKGRAFPKTS